MLKNTIFLFFIITSLSYAKTINIAVAANVSYAIDSLKKEFNKSYPDIKLKTTLGSSGKLTAQIKNGAPYDLFLSANMNYPNSLYKENYAVTKPMVYAKGALALFSSKKRDFSKGLSLLESKTIRRIAIANPKTAPYGIAAFEALENAKILSSIKKKFVYGESISSTVSYALRATDIGLVAKSSLYSSKMKRFKKDINYADVDPKLYTPISQGAVVLKNGQNKYGAKEFFEFLKTKNAKKILLNYGYQVP